MGMDGASLMDEESSPRACALTTSQDSLSSQCSPIVRVESCESLCTLDPSGLFYTQCTVQRPDVSAAHHAHPLGGRLHLW